MQKEASGDKDALRQLFDMKNRVVIVTGGTRGIGLALAEGYVAAGAGVVLRRVLAWKVVRARRNVLKLQTTTRCFARRGPPRSLDGGCSSA